MPRRDFVSNKSVRIGSDEFNLIEADQIQLRFAQNELKQQFEATSTTNEAHKQPVMGAVQSRFGVSRLVIHHQFTKKIQKLENALSPLRVIVVVKSGNPDRQTNLGVICLSVSIHYRVQVYHQMTHLEQ